MPGRPVLNLPSIRCDAETESQKLRVSAQLLESALAVEAQESAAAWEIHGASLLERIDDNIVFVNVMARDAAAFVWVQR